MSYELVAEGRTCGDLNQQVHAIVSQMPLGTQLALELELSRDVTDADLQSVASLVEALRAEGVQAKSDAWGNQVNLYVTVPRSTPGVGIVWFIPLLAIGGVLTALVGWRLFTLSTGDFIKALLPIALIAFGAWIIFKEVGAWKPKVS